MPKQPVIAMFIGSSAKLWGREVGFGASVKDSNDLVSVSEFVMFVTCDVSYGGKRLLDHVRNDALSLAGTIVIDGHAVTEYTEGPGKIVGSRFNEGGGDRVGYDLRVAADVILLAEVRFVNAVNLRKFDALLF
jgi:hypothetical protein